VNTRACRHCGREIPATRPNGQPRVACNAKCGALSREYPVEPRFWSRVRKTDGCWEWTGRIATSGYGSLSRENRPAYAHRVSWELHNGPIPARMWILHRCDNRVCVNPAHLYAGTPTENSRDMHERGRWRPSVQPPVSERQLACKLTPADVMEIRACRARGEPVVALAARFGVNVTTIRCAAKGKTWAHIGQADLSTEAAA
jgi:hypothetical protein